MNTKVKKALMIGGPIVLAITIIIILSKKSSAQKPAVPVPNTDVPPVKVPAPASTAYFPLKNGSNNSKVKELQTAIGTTADGIFGPNTEKALVAFSGVKTVDTQAELDAIKAQAKNATATAATIARANDIIARYNAGGTLATTRSVAPKQVTIDSYGALYSGGAYITMYGPKAYNREDYTPTIATKGGGLVFKINNGDLAGTYLVDANSMTIQ